MLVGFNIFHALQVYEDKAEYKGQSQKCLQHATLTCDQCVMSNCQCHRTAQQQRCVDQRQAERAHWLVVATHVARSVSRPGAFVAWPEQQVREESVAVAAEPRNRHVAGVKQGAEEYRKEHDLGEDEPKHAHAERDANLAVIDAALIFTDNGSEPACEHENDRAEAGKHDPGACLGTVKPRGSADHEQQQAK